MLAQRMIFAGQYTFLVNRNNIKEVDAKNRVLYFEGEESCLEAARMMKDL